MSDAVAQERVRMYERSKLRWHFAIAEFNTPRAAAAVYAECDGIEFEESSTRFDLRFVPDSEDFSKREVRGLGVLKRRAVACAPPTPPPSGARLGQRCAIVVRGPHVQEQGAAAHQADTDVGRG